MAEFYLDHNVAREIGARLRRAGHGARDAQELGLARAGDDEHLYLLHDAWRRWANGWNVREDHAGILVLIPPITAVQAVETVEELLASAQPFTNELYTWRLRTGWVRKP